MILDVPKIHKALCQYTDAHRALNRLLVERTDETDVQPALAANELAHDALLSLLVAAADADQ